MATSGRDLWTPEATAQRLKIIGGALLSGCTMFGVIIAIMGVSEPAERPLIAWIAAGFAFLMLAAGRIVPRIMASGQSAAALARAGDDPDRRRAALCEVFQTTSIVAMALPEGAAFFNLIAWLIDGQLWSLGVAVGLMFVMAMQIPSAGRVDGFLADQERRARDGF